MNNAVIFDLDGTLWNSIDTTYISVNEITKKYHLKEIPKETIFSVFGCNKEECAKIYFPNLNIDDAYKLLDEIDEVNNHNLEINGAYIFPGLDETLFLLHQKYKLFIVSNSQSHKYIESFLVSSKLWKYFDGYLAASEIKLSKGEAIIKLINDYNIDNAIYVGDTKKDYEASIVANIPFIQCIYGFGNDLNTKYKINEIKDLIMIVELIFNKEIN